MKHQSVIIISKAVRTRIVQLCVRMKVQYPEFLHDFEEIGMADTDNSAQGDAGKGDRFGVLVDPQSVVGFLDRVNMNLNEQSVIYLLLTLPFYEHEWDMSGFVLSSMFNDDDDDMDEEDGSTE